MGFKNELRNKIRIWKEKYYDWKQNDYSHWKRYALNPWKNRVLKKVKRFKKKIKRKFKSYRTRYKAKPDKSVKKVYSGQQNVFLVNEMNIGQKKTVNRNVINFYPQAATNEGNLTEQTLVTPPLNFQFQDSHSIKNNRKVKDIIPVENSLFSDYLRDKRTRAEKERLPNNRHFKQLEYKKRDVRGLSTLISEHNDILDMYESSKHKEVVLKSIDLIETILKTLSSQLNFEYESPADFLEQIEERNLRGKFLFLNEIVDFKNFLMFHRIEIDYHKFSPENAKSIFSILNNMMKKLKERSRKKEKKQKQIKTTSEERIHNQLNNMELEYKVKPRQNQEAEEWKELNALIKDLAKLEK